jgi:hypothetical protein
MVKGNMGSLKVRSVYSNLEENFYLNACVLLRHKSIKQLLIQLFTEFSFAKGLANVKLGELVDGSYLPY